MGKLIYEGHRVEVDDRALTHLQIVIGAKLRRGEAFYFTWKDDPAVGDGRTTIWVHPRCTLLYKFYGGRTASINRAWIEILNRAANSAEGLYLIAEPPDGGRVEPRRG